MANSYPRITHTMQQAVADQIKTVVDRLHTVTQAEGEAQREAVADLSRSVDILRMCVTGLRDQLSPLVPQPMGSVKN